MAQNEMNAKPALPERVRSMEGLGVTGTEPWAVPELGNEFVVLAMRSDPEPMNAVFAR